MTKPLTGSALAATAAEEVMPGKVHYTYSGEGDPTRPQPRPGDYIIDLVRSTGRVREVYFLPVCGGRRKVWRPDRDIAAAVKVLAALGKMRIEVHAAFLSALKAISCHSEGWDSIGDWFFFYADKPLVITQAAVEVMREAKGTES